MPSFTDNFESGTLNADVGTSPDWAVLAGSWIYTDNLGDRGANPDTAGSVSNNTLRANFDVGSPDMYAEAVFTELKTGRKHAVTARMNTTGTTFYWGGWVGTAWQIRRVTTGPNATGSILVNGDTVAPTAPWTTRLEVEDNASGDPVLTLYSDGVQKAQFTDTDAAKILTGNFGGMFETTNGQHRGSFSVGSLLAVPAGQGGATVLSTHTVTGQGSTDRSGGAGVTAVHTTTGQGSTIRSGSATVTATSTVTGTGTASSAGPSGSATVTVSHTVTGLGGNPLTDPAPTPPKATLISGVSEPVTLPRQARWSYVTALTDGTEQADLDARSRSLTVRLDDAAQAGFTISGRDPQAAYVDELRSDLIVYRDKQRLFRGRIMQGQDQGSADRHTLTVTAHDYRKYLDHRIVWTPLDYIQIDQEAIGWALIDHTQTQTAGDLGITRGAGQTTGILRDRTYVAGKKIGEALGQLGEVAGGFDWAITPDHTFQVWYPQRGNTTPKILAYGENVDSFSRAVSPADFGNAIRHTGDDGLTAQTRTAANLTTTPEGRWDLARGDIDIKRQTTLNQRADTVLADSANLTPAYTLGLAGGWWQGPDHLWLGDTVQVQIRSGRLDVDQPYRVLEVSIGIDDDGAEDVTVTVGRVPAKVRRAARKIGSRLATLERR